MYGVPPLRYHCTSQGADDLGVESEDFLAIQCWILGGVPLRDKRVSWVSMNDLMRAKKDLRFPEPARDKCRVLPDPNEGLLMLLLAMLPVNATT